MAASRKNSELRFAYKVPNEKNVGFKQEKEWLKSGDRGLKTQVQKCRLSCGVRAEDITKTWGPTIQKEMRDSRRVQLDFEVLLEVKIAFRPD